MVSNLQPGFWRSGYSAVCAGCYRSKSDGIYRTEQIVDNLYSALRCDPADPACPDDRDDLADPGGPDWVPRPSPGPCEQVPERRRRLGCVR